MIDSNDGDEDEDEDDDVDNDSIGKYEDDNNLIGVCGHLEHPCLWL